MERMRHWTPPASAQRPAVYQSQERTQTRQKSKPTIGANSLTILSGMRIPIRIGSAFLESLESVPDPQLNSEKINFYFVHVENTKY